MNRIVAQKQNSKHAIKSIIVTLYLTTLYLHCVTKMLKFSFSVQYGKIPDAVTGVFPDQPMPVIWNVEISLVLCLNPAQIWKNKNFSLTIVSKYIFLLFIPRKFKILYKCRYQSVNEVLKWSSLRKKSVSRVFEENQ